MRFKHTKHNSRYVNAQNSVDIKKLVKRSFATFVAVVVFVTAYALILPAKTETVPECGLNEHSHTAQCYSVHHSLICENMAEEHIHTDECYTDEEALTCENEVHVHNEECYHKAEAVVDNETVVDDEEKSEVEAVAQQEEDLSNYVDFENYVNEVGGYITSSLFDSNNTYIEHIYEASGEGYTYMLHIYSPKVLPDTYIYYLPEGIAVDIASREGDISKGSSSIGKYRISDDCKYILFNFFTQTSTVQSIRGEITLSVDFKVLTEPAVEKTGYYISEDGFMDGFFHFEVLATIPKSGRGVPKREWKIVDNSEITGSSMWTYDFGNEQYDDELIVSISYENIDNQEIFNIKDVYDNPDVQMAYYVDSNTKAFYLVNRCTCSDEEECCLDYYENVCHSLDVYDGWCSCWSFDKDVRLTLRYKNAVNGVNGSQILSDQNTLKTRTKNQYKNSVYLTGSYNDGANLISETENSYSVVNYSNMIDKTETKEASAEGGYESVFTLTINPDKADFSRIDADSDEQYDNKVIVLDTMNNLKYISGSMRIVAEDMEGNELELEYGTDFDVTCEPTDTGNRLEIKLLKLGRYKYTITYSTTVFNENQDSIVKIANNVSLCLYGHIYEYSEPTYQYARTFVYDDNWDYLRYMINILKVDYYNREIYLPGAEFGLYSADGYQIATAVTDENGECLFETNAEKDIIFTTDAMYYISEITAPNGYELDTTKHWFYFSKNQNSVIEAELDSEYPNVGVNYVPLSEDNEYILNLELTNEKLFVLPETGGSSDKGFIVAGAVILLISLSCIFFKGKIKNKNQSLKHSKKG